MFDYLGRQRREQASRLAALLVNARPRVTDDSALIY
jgi:hypothetical protein